MTRRGAVLAAVALATGLLAACDSDAGPARAKPGGVYEAVAGHVAARTVTLRTPQGRLDARAGALRTEITLVGAGTRLAAPEGGHFVPVEIDQGPPSSGPTTLRDGDTGAPLASDTFPTLRLALVADGHRYPIDAGVLTGSDYYGTPANSELEDQQKQGDLPYGAVYVAVHGTPSRLGLEVREAGTTQVVDLRTGTRHTGGAAGLYAVDPAPRAAHSCGRAVVSRGVVADGASCLIDWTRTAWIGGRGFAPSGKAWLVARLDIDATGDVSAAGTYVYLDHDPALAFRFGGAPVVRVQAREIYAGDISALEAPRVAFLVPARPEGDSGTLTVRATYGRRDGPGAPVTFTWRTAIR